MAYGMLGKNGTVGQNGTGQNGTIPFYPHRCFVLPRCPGTFYPMPIPTTKIPVLTVFKRFLEEEVNSLRPSGEYYPVKWVIIGSDNGLSPVQRHAILIDAHLFKFEHQVQRYSAFILIKMQRLQLNKTHNEISFVKFRGQ